MDKHDYELIHDPLAGSYALLNTKTDRDVTRLFYNRHNGEDICSRTQDEAYDAMHWFAQGFGMGYEQAKHAIPSVTVRTTHRL